MSKESFQYPETAPIFKTLEDISQRSSVSRGRAFEDTIRASVAALAAETMEEEYFEAIKEHTQGKVGKRGVDLFGKFFGQTVEAIDRHDHDILGDMFQGAISHHENAFYMTPQPISEMLARMTIADSEVTDQKPVTIHDPCVGTGILLIESGKQHPTAELCGIDVDSRCADIAAINLGLRSRYGWIVCGNSLSQKMQYAYRIGSFFHEGPNGRRRGVIRKVPLDQCPVLPELQAGPTRELSTTTNDEVQTTEVEKNCVTTNIVEIPRWVLQLESSSLRQESTDVNVEETVQPETPSKSITPAETQADRKVDRKSSTPPRQQNLF